MFVIRKSLYAHPVLWTFNLSFYKFPKQYLGALSLWSTEQTVGIVWNPKLLYRIHKMPQLDPILQQRIPIHAPVEALLHIQVRINAFLEIT